MGLFSNKDEYRFKAALPALPVWLWVVLGVLVAVIVWQQFKD